MSDRADLAGKRGLQTRALAATASRIPGVVLCVLVTLVAIALQALQESAVGHPYVEAIVIAIVLGTAIRTGGGYHVALIARSEKRLPNLKAEIPDSSTYICDVTQENQIIEAVAKITRDFGAPEVAIHNAVGGAFEWQKQRYLPGIRDGSEVWCQGYSEPNAGSDLASLRTAAIRKGDRYVVNGQKMWTGEGHFADMIFCLVRTDTSVPKQSGISMILIDMKSPGGTVKPIITMDMGHNVNEVFFEDVEVPLENLIGDEGKGWTYAKFLLENERTYSAYLPESKRDLLRLKKYIERGAPMLREDERFDTEVAQLEIDLAAHEAMIYRILLGNLTINPAGAASMIRIRGAEIRQRLANMWVEALGPQTLLLPTDHDHADDVAGAMGQALFRRSVSIYGGANEIQHGIIAKRGLGL